MSDTLFRQVNYDLDSLVKVIELRQIGLPDIQRPSACRARNMLALAGRP